MSDQNFPGTVGGEIRISSLSILDQAKPGNLYLRSGNVPSGSSPIALSGGFGGNIILELGHERRECIRFTPDGKVYVRGELVEDNKEVWEAVKAWLAASNILWRSSDSVVSGGDGPQKDV